MNAHPPISRGLAVLTLLLAAVALPATLHGQAGNTPAFALPESLWIPGVFRAGETALSGNQLPIERDSTTWDSLWPPSCSYGEEIFESLDVAGDYLYVAYGAGFSIWDISGANAEDPERVLVRDLESCLSPPEPFAPPPGNHCNVSCALFLLSPGLGEQDFLIEDIDVLEAGGSTVYIAVSGFAPVGMSLWRFNTTTESLSPLYQDTTRSSNQVRIVEVAGNIYALTSYDLASTNQALSVYDVTRAEAIDPCLETGSNCSGVYLGNLGTISDGHFLDVLVRTTGEVLVATSNGNFEGQGLELWEVSDLSSPGTATQLFDGLNDRTFGTALFAYEGNEYLAALEWAGSPNVNVIKIFNINACRGGSCSLGAPVFDDVSVAPRRGDQFLTYSTSNGTPFLYYGLVGGFGGPHVEQLLNLTTLGRPGQNITEMTDGAPTYFDNNQNANLDYWAWYYPLNEFGFTNFSPTIGKFNPETNFFYRAARGALDVHVWEGAESDPVITTSVSNPDPQDLYWMTDEITFEGEGSNGCDPVGSWTWTPTTPAEVDAVVVNETGNQVSYRFECTARGSGRCADAVVSVSGANDDPSCDGAMTIAAGITVKDPSVEITSIDPSSGTFTQCETVTFEAELLGRGPVDFAWNVNGIEGEAGVVPEEELSTSMLSFDWDTTTVTFGEIFSDGFESGDTSAWGTTRATQRGTLPVTIELVMGTGSPTDSVGVDLSPVTGDPTFETPAISSSTTDNSTFDFQANTVTGTVSEWSWELEDDNGSSLCTFGVDTNVPCTLKTGEAINHTWLLQNGDRRVDLTIGNCQTETTAEASTTVSVVSTEQLEVTSFELDRAQSDGACEINFDCISDLICLCHTGETVFFEVLATGEPDVYDFDWNGDGTFEDTNNPATGTEFTKIYPTVLGQIVPAVRARRGTATPAEKDLRETLDIQP